MINYYIDNNIVDNYNNSQELYDLYLKRRNIHLN